MTCKVLVVDDSKLARMAVAKALLAVRPRWTRVEAANADEAIAALNDSNPDIALLDFNMPGRNGLEVAAELRRLRPAMPIALISANHQVEIVDSAAAIGATFLDKPLTHQALTNFLSDVERRLDAAKG
jgi:CheY-like chemotaxis protein